MVEPVEEPKEPRTFTQEDLHKMLYCLLNTVGGKSQVASIPTKVLDEMPKDWMDRIGMREIPGMGVSQVFLRPRRSRKKHKEVKLILPEQRKIIV
jgi:hypothetical protein